MNSVKQSRDATQMKTRLDLIESGLFLIAENGYGSVSIRNITKHAGYTQGAFYSNFNNKEDFLLALMKIQFEKENLQLQQIISQKYACLEEMLDALQHWLRDFFNQFEWLKISIELQLYATRNEEFSVEYQKVWQVHKNEVMQLFRLLNRTGQTEAAFEQSITVLISLSYGLALQYMIFKDDLQKYIDIIMQHVGGLAPAFENYNSIAG